MERHEREWLRSQMAELADGNRAVFEAVYERVWPLVRGFVGRHLAPADADDAAQDALLSVFARSSEFDRSRDALTWILGIAAWEIRTTRTRRRRRREDTMDEAAVSGRPSNQESPEESAMNAQRNRWIEDALAGLDPADEATIRAYMSGERPAVPATTFRKRVQRAVERLRSGWKTGHGPV